MVVLQIAFVMVNLAVPYWLWSKKSPTVLPAVEREAVGRAIFRVIAASGGFPPCDTDDLVEDIQELCDQSRLKYSDKTTIAFERAGTNVVFSCEVRKNEVKVKWTPENVGQPDMDCHANSDEQIDYAPSFSFNLKGKIRTIGYSTPAGKRATTEVKSCRRKLASAKAMGDRIPASEDEFLSQLVHLPNDPPDVLTKNKVCFLFDPAEDWDPFRDKYDDENMEASAD
ncbi:MAG: hypothetical protein KF799_14395 [Bdellovibrionales bacterium]|nr:hypothetical protein [Bdellovibrionales bacterium]